MLKKTGSIKKEKTLSKKHSGQLCKIRKLLHKSDVKNNVNLTKTKKITNRYLILI